MRTLVNQQQLTRQFLGDGIPYVCPLSHARAVLNHARNASGINAVDFSSYFAPTSFNATCDASEQV
jgi:hypothetical protein